MRNASRCLCVFDAASVMLNVKILLYRIGTGRGRSRGRGRLQPLQAGTQLQTLSSGVDPVTSWPHPLPVSTITN